MYGIPVAKRKPINGYVFKFVRKKQLLNWTVKFKTKETQQIKIEFEFIFAKEIFYLDEYIVSKMCHRFS